MSAALLLSAAGLLAPNLTHAAGSEAESLLFGGTALDMASMQNDNVMQRIAALRAGAHGVDLAGLSVQAGERRIGGDSLNAVSGPILSPVFDGVLNRGDSGRWGAFANGDVRRIDGSNDSIGMTTGVDYRFGDNLAVGSSLAYANFDAVADPRREMLGVESRRVSLFGTYYRQKLMHVDGLIAYGSSAYDSARRVDHADLAGMPATASGTTSGKQVSAALNGALDLQNGPWRFGPKVGARFLDVGVGRLSEFGAGEQDLTIGDQSAQSLRLSGGAYLSLALPLPFGVLMPNVNADFVRDDVRWAVVPGHLRTDPGARLTLTPDALSPLDPGYFVWSVGASAQFVQALSGFVNYRTLAGVDSPTSNELTWGVRFETKLH